MLGNGTRGLAEHDRKHIVEPDVGHGEIMNQVAKLMNDGLWDEVRLDHASYE